MPWLFLTIPAHITLQGFIYVFGLVVYISISQILFWGLCNSHILRKHKITYTLNYLPVKYDYSQPREAVHCVSKLTVSEISPYLEKISLWIFSDRNWEET